MRKLLILAILVFAAPAWAQPWVLRTEYSAEMVVNGGRDGVTRLYRTPQTLRTETPAGQQTIAVIARLDRNLAWVLIPNMRTAAELTLSEFQILPGLQPGPNTRVNREGDEQIEGTNVTRWRVTTEQDGRGFDGFIWTTSEGIVLRIAGEGQAQGRRSRVDIIARNVRIGRQAPTLFEIPNGYNRMQVPAEMVAAFLGGNLPGVSR